MYFLGIMVQNEQDNRCYKELKVPVQYIGLEKHGKHYFQCILQLQTTGLNRRIALSENIKKTKIAHAFS